MFHAFLKHYFVRFISLNLNILNIGLGDDVAHFCHSLTEASRNFVTDLAPPFPTPPCKFQQHKELVHPVNFLLLASYIWCEAGDWLAFGGWYPTRI